MNTGNGAAGAGICEDGTGFLFLVYVVLFSLLGVLFSLLGVLFSLLGGRIASEKREHKL